MSKQEGLRHHVSACKGFFFPLMAPRGLIFCSLILLIPVCAMLFEFPVKEQLTFCIAFLLAFVAFLLWSYFRCRQLAQALLVDIRAPSVLRSGVAEEIEVKLSIGLRSLPELSLTMPLNILHSPLDISWHAAGNGVFRASFIPLERIRLDAPVIYIRLLAPFSVCRWQFALQLAEPFTREIQPNSVPEEEQEFGAMQQGAGQLVLRQNRGEGREFDSLRHYVPGDDLRRVDWKRSAKGFGLLVKTYRPESHQRIQIILDCGRRLATRVGKRQQIEYATDAVAQLLRGAHTMDDEFGFFAFHSQAIASIPCRRGSFQQEVILETLKEVQCGELESDYQLLRDWTLSQKRRSLVLLITAVSNPSGIESILQALLPVKSRHLPCILAIADPSLEASEQQSADSLLDAYQIAAAIEHKKRLQETLKRCERYGISSLYTEAHTLSRQLRQTYFEMKVSGRL